ncbi:MAG TPA: IS1634 family transposase, partial [Patescibacteria group bacterium]|nr:IS1634 family transposase [Patescibacteria group bacterium]
AVYEGLPKLILLKDEAEKIAVSYAKQTFGFDFSMVFYDVTTLYYESCREDADIFDEEGNMIEKGLRKGGLGKEIKIGQPIIVIGLMVTKEGFPISYEVYEGNTFEGDTFIPSILGFKKKYNIQTFTIVADAAMISFDNVEKLKEQQLSYIVGARIANLKQTEMAHIHTELIGDNQTAEELQKIDGKSIRTQTKNGLLICDFSLKRYKKDKREMEKQIIRAENLVAKNTEGKRTKFLMLKQTEKITDKKKKKGKDKKEKAYELNTDLIEKTKRLLGTKGYYTNLFEKDETLTDADIITHYHNLWHVEKAFRIAKSDLAARPIFHHKRDSIEAHILIVFSSLCLAKAIEMKTNYSIRSVNDMIWDILDITFTDKLTGKQFVKRMDVEDNPMVKLLEN